MSRINVARRAVRGAFAVCSILSVTAVLAEPAGHDASPPASDQAVLVTASRVPESLDNTLWSSTVLTRADIDARQASSLQELLGDLAGINIVNNGGLGKVSTVLMRGGESEHTLLLIDGVRVASATAGTAPFELIPLGEIERIEVVRGPRSTLYGTDAVGGVIQIFTRRAPQAGVNFGGSVSGGSHDMQRIGLDLQGGNERAWVSLGAESFDTDGINSCAAGALAAFAACFANELDRDGYRSNSGSLAAGYAFNDSWKAEAHSLVADGRTEYDGSIFSGNLTEFSERVFALSVDGALNSKWHTRAVLGRNQDHQDNFYNGAPAGTFNTDRDTASVQLDGTIGETLRLITGVEHQQDSIDSDIPYDVDSRSTSGVFGELHGQLGAWSALAGARYEDNQQFGSRVTGNAGLARALNERVRLTATWGTAFHAPTFNDLYFPGFSNPALRPEESRSLELGLNGRAAGTALNWSLHVFQTDVDQLIGLDAGFAVVNIDKSRIRGAELAADWHNAVWKIGGQYSRLDPIDRSDGNLLPRRRSSCAGSGRRSPSARWRATRARASTTWPIRVRSAGSSFWILRPSSALAGR
jgi:vitamin B12 transporter